MLLDRPTLEALTGTVQPKRMCAWLDANGWVYLPPERRGELPKVGRAYFDARMAGLRPSQPQAEPARPRLNLDWMQPA